MFLIGFGLWVDGIGVIGDVSPLGFETPLHKIYIWLEERERKRLL
jgi:hypothetical protein